MDTRTSTDKSSDPENKEWEEVRQMDREELIRRFLELECDKRDWNQNTATNQMYVSSDNTVGIPLFEDTQARYMSFGRFRLKKGKRMKAVVKVLDGLHFNTRLLYRAMCVLHRRTKFELGLFHLDHGPVFAVKEGDNIVLIAPAICGMSNCACPDFETLVTRSNQSFKKWKMWSKILHSPRD